ncbi:MAG: response regulator [Fibrobacterota bacterium]|nr:response regulator [Fibrobacterota bacterium]
MAYNILIVDDSETVRAVIAKAIEMSGTEVKTLFTACNGEEALGILDREWVDLVFADINMPVMGGVELVKRMKADEDTKKIPVVIVSTEGSATRIKALMDSGIAAFLRKPFTPEGLKSTIDEIMGK